MPVCSSCGASGNLDDVFCGKCGTKQIGPTVGKSKSPGCLIGWIGLLIGVSPAIFGPIQVAEQCGANANEGNCGPYMWPLMLIFTLPIGLVLGIIAIVRSKNAKQ